MEEKQIKIADLLWLAWQRLWALALAFVIFAVGAFFYCEKMVTPQYKSTASILVTNGAVIDDKTLLGGSATVSNTDVAASLNLVETITDILNTSDIYKHLAEELNGKYVYSQLMNSCSVERRGDMSLFVDVVFTNESPEEAMRIANTFVSMSCEYITSFIPNSNAIVASSAVRASLAYPHTLKTSFLAGAIAAVILYLILFLVEITNHSIKGEEDFVARYTVPLLGSVPDFENVETGTYYFSGGQK